MDLRLKHLSALDGRAAPLPHGTEVLTRVDRVLPGPIERRVPQGSVGRVQRTGPKEGASDDEQVDVLVTGVGVLRYARHELTPRRVGQALFAAHRADAWDALRGCVVLDTTVGSRAWGLATADSDEDHRGLFALPFSWTTGLVAPPEDLVSADGSDTYWAIGKAVRQALRADPNTLEALFVPSARALDPIGEWVLEARDAFVSTEIYGTFGRYALAQLARLEQGIRLAEHRASVLAWLRDDATLDLDAVARRLATAVPTGGAPTEALLRAKQYVKQLYRSMHDQALLDACDFPSLVRFARDRSHDFDLPREFRPKNAYNLVRLLATATRWLEEGAPTFEVSGPLRERLLAIKRGEVPLGEVLAEAEGMVPDLERARDRSRLPPRPDVARADALLRRVGQDLARRSVERAPGPLGVDAPPPPEVAWNED